MAQNSNTVVAYAVILALLIFYLVIFFNGMFDTAFFRTFIVRPIVGAQAEMVKAEIRAEPYPEVYWNKPREDKKGVTVHDTQAAYDGVTFFVTARETTAVIIDMEGNVLHEWSLPFDKVWPDPPHIKDPASASHIAWRRGHVYPNGDLLAIYYGLGDVIWGYGLAKIDKDSNLIWKVDEAIHHDMAVAGNGEIYTLSHTLRTEAFAGMGHIAPPFLEDYLVIVTPEGRVRKKISFLEAFANSDYSDVLKHMKADPTGGELPPGDILHPNSVAIVTENFASYYPFLKAGQVLVSFRNNDMLAVIDPEEEKTVWATLGPWRHQHDPDILPGGDILLFDNDGHIGPGGRTRLIEVDPRTMAIRWSYAGTAETPFETKFMGDQQRLPNGNTLATESMNGRIIEVTREGRIVWDYRSPWRAGKESELVPTFFGALRFRRNELPFLDIEE